MGEGFQPELGFLKREAFRRNYLVAHFSPRPKSPEWIRRLVWQLDYDRITDPSGRLETRKAVGQFLQFAHHQPSLPLGVPAGKRSLLRLQ